MINLVLSRSQQAGNVCVMGDTEQHHTGLICDAIYDRLKNDNRFNLYNIPQINTGSDMENLKKAVEMSNEFISEHGGKGFHLSIHSDGGYNGRGASGFYYSDEGREFGKPIYDEMVVLTPWRDMRFYSRRSLYELNSTVAIAFLLEVSFHDNFIEAKWIHENIGKIADTIISGLYTGLGLTPLQPDRELIRAIRELHSYGVINTPDYWILNAHPGGTVKGEYAGLLLKNMANKISELKTTDVKTKE